MRHRRAPTARAILRTTATFSGTARHRRRLEGATASQDAGIRSAHTPDVMRLPVPRSSAWWAAAGVGILGVGYLTLAAAAWARFGHARRSHPDEADDLLDRFIPSYETVERH